MKTFCKKYLVLLLAIALLLPTLAACASLGEPALKLGKTEITENMIEFWLTRYKAEFLYYYRSAILNEYSTFADFWADTAEDGRTYDEIFTANVIESAKTYLCVAYLFDEKGLSLPEETVAAVDKTISDMIENLADGSSSEFNTQLAQYGVNKKILRELYLLEEKAEYLKNYLFSDSGEKRITQKQKDEYYNDNFLRMEQICIFINETPKLDSDGNYEKDDDGYTAYRDMTEEENKKAREKAAEAFEKAVAGADFDDLVKKYDENKADDGYTGGIYMSTVSASGYDESLGKIYEELSDMEIGSVAMVETENGLHIIKRLPLEEKAYEDDANTDFFTFWDSRQQNYVTYEQYLRTPFFLEYINGLLEEYADKIKIDEDIIKSLKISSVNANYDF